MTKLRAAAIAAVAVLTTVIAVDETNVISQVARKAIEIIRLTFGI